MAGWRQRRIGSVGQWPTLAGIVPGRPHHQIIAVDHLRPAADAEDGHHVRRGAALDLFGVLGVVGDEAAADLVGVGAAHHHGIAAGELAVDPDHAGRQQAFAGAQRGDRAGVDGQRALRLQRARDPAFSRGDGIGRRQEPGAAAAIGDRLQRMLDLARRDQHMRAGRGRDLRRLDLGVHAAARQFGFGRARHRLDFGGDGFHDRNQFCVGIGAGRRVVEAVDVGQQDQQIGARHGGDARGEAIIVAIADFVGGDRVVLVDDGHRAPFQQFGDGRAGVEIAAALLGVLQRHQDLSGADAVIAEHFRPDPRQRDLADGGRALAFLELQRAARQFQAAAAERNRAGRDHQDVAALAMQFGDIGGQRRQPRRAHLAGLRNRSAATSRP